MKPSEIYTEEINAGRIIEDAAQRAALGHFDNVFAAILQSANRNWLQMLWQKQNPKGLYVWGGVGTGKTLLMDIFFRSLPQGIARRIHFHRFMQYVHKQKNQVKDQQNPLEIVASKFANKHQVLCLDEFSVTDITDAMILHGLLKSLFSNSVALITTSNIPQKDLYKDGLQRSRFLPAIDLLEQHTDQIQVDGGNDYRMSYLRNNLIYHFPLNEESKISLQQSFSRLAGLDEESKTSIEIDGRSVDVVATGSGVAWFEFAVLCGGNRSKTDYIEISHRFHSVILANIPALDDETNDPVRRLIELVDELYDRGVNLIISAALPAHQLYNGRRLAAPFQRTISRLQEMSSLDYIGRPHIG